MELRGIEYLRQKLSQKQARVRTRYAYYEMKNVAPDLSKLIPAEMSWLTETLGWCAKAVDALSDRLVFGRFAEDKYMFGSLYGKNNGRILMDSAILGALIASCSFIYLCEGEDGEAKMQTVDGYNATGIIDPTNNMLLEGYAVLERDDYGTPTLEAYFIPGETYYFGGGKAWSIKHASKYPALVPNLFRPDAVRPFGHSRISRACMKLVDGALRTLRRSEVSAEFYSFPQKYILGLSQEAEFNNRAAAVSSFLAFDKDEDGDRPVLGQFNQQSMSPFVEQMKMFAALFAAETGLTLDDLGFPSDNPSSAEAIKAAHENLRLTARKAQRTFETGFKNAGIIGASIRDGQAYDANDCWFTEIRWEPLFEPDATSIGAMADGILKISQAIPDFVTPDKMHEITGL